ncbi:MAG: hypothetical protein Q9171_002649 [Xanthocarpia ochracea]
MLIQLKDFFDNTVTDTIDQVSNFIVCSDHRSTEATIPTALITVGPDNSTYTTIVRSIETRLQKEHDVVVTNIVPSQTTNLKSALKFINNHVTGAALTAEGDHLSKHEKVESSTSDDHLLV